MTTYEDLVSPSEQPGEPVQKTKSPTALVVCYIIGLLFIILSLICRIPQIKYSINSMLSSTPIDVATLTTILLGIALVFCIIGAVFETKLKKKNQITGGTAKFLKVMNILCWILLAISIILMFIK